MAKAIRKSKQLSLLAFLFIIGMMIFAASGCKAHKPMPTKYGPPPIQNN